MNEIVCMLNSKLPMELVNKILFEFGGLQAPSALIIRKEIDLIEDKMARHMYRYPWYHYMHERHCYQIRGGVASSWITGQMVAFFSRVLLDGLNRGNGKAFWDSNGQDPNDLWPRVRRRCHLPELPMGMDPDLTFEDRIERVRWVGSRLGYHVSESIVRSLASLDNQIDARMMMKSLDCESMPYIILDHGPFNYKPYVNYLLDRADVS